MAPPLKDAFEELALSVSFFQSEEECQLENVFEAAEIVQYVNPKLYDERGEGEGEREYHLHIALGNS